MVRKMNVAPPSGHFINLICLTTRNDTDRVTIDGIPNEKTIFFFQILWSGRKDVDVGEFCTIFSALCRPRLYLLRPTLEKSET